MNTETEIKQIKRRFGSSFTESKIDSGILIGILFVPSDPDFSIDLENGLPLKVFFPQEYPNVPLRVEIDSNALSFEVKSLLADSCKKFCSLLVGQYMFRDLLKWFDRHVEELLLMGLKIPSGKYPKSRINDESIASMARSVKQVTAVTITSSIPSVPPQAPLESDTGSSKLIINENENVSHVKAESSFSQPKKHVFLKIVKKETIAEEKVAENADESELSDSSESESDNDDEKLYDALVKRGGNKINETLTDLKICDKASDWSVEDEALLEQSLILFPSSLPVSERWVKISDHVKKPKSQCVKQFKLIRERLLLASVSPKSPQVESSEIRSKHIKVIPLKQNSNSNNEKSFDVHLLRETSLKLMEDKEKSQNDIFDMQSESEESSIDGALSGAKSTRISLISHHKGTRINLIEMSLTNIGVITPQNLHCLVACNRCNLYLDLLLLPGIAQISECNRCHLKYAAQFRPEILHENSTSFGYIDVENCSMFDLLPTSINISCHECSTLVCIPDIKRSYKHELNCSQCHTKLIFRFQNVSFEVLAVKSEPLLRKSVKIKAKIETTFKVGESLPEKGTCKHYRRSYRWFRFACCNKALPCDICHDDLNLGHELKMASRMICGNCSLEQPFSQKPCKCGQLFTSVSKVHWEGGKGCRNRNNMCNKDSKKFSGLNKTISRRAMAKKFPTKSKK